MLQAKIGQEMQKLYHFETPKDFEHPIWSIFQGATKGGFLTKCLNICQALLCICCGNCNTASHCTCRNLFVFNPRSTGTDLVNCNLLFTTSRPLWSSAPADPARRTLIITLSLNSFSRVSLCTIFQFINTSTSIVSLEPIKIQVVQWRVWSKLRRLGSL